MLRNLSYKVLRMVIFLENRMQFVALLSFSVIVAKKLLFEF